MARFIKNNLANLLVIFVIAILVSAGIFYYLTIITKGAEKQEIKILPTAYSGTWSNQGAALIQDLGPEADFEEFNKENSTYSLEGEKVEIQPKSESIIEEEFEDLSEEETASPSEDLEELIVPPVEEEILSPSEDFEEIATSSEEIIVSESEDFEEISSPSEPFKEVPVSPSESLLILLDLIATESFEELATESSSYAPDEATEDKEEIIEEPVEELATESEIIIDQELIDEVATESEEVIEEEMPEPEIELFPDFVESTLEFSDFGIPPFEEGEEKPKIENVQLRLSLAGKGEVGDKLTIDYHYQDSWQNLAEFDLENEISNATNNGYWLYALPIFKNWKNLNDLKIRFTLRSLEENDWQDSLIYLDAIWIEVEYESSVAVAMEDKEEIKEEGLSSQTWEEFDGWDNEIFVEMEGQSIQITNNEIEDWNAQKNGEFVVWEGLVNKRWQVFLVEIKKKGLLGRTLDFFTKRFSTKYKELKGFKLNTTQLTDTNYNNSKPQVSEDGRIVWQAWPEGSEQWEIFFFDGQTTHQLTNNIWPDVEPKISGDWIAWEGYIEKGVPGKGFSSKKWEIFLYHIPSNRLKSTDNQIKDSRPLFKQGRLFWRSGKENTSVNPQNFPGY